MRSCDPYSSSFGEPGIGVGSGWASPEVGTGVVLFRGHYDFVTSRGLSIGDVSTVPQGQSDHMPILVSVDYRRG